MTDRLQVLREAHTAYMQAKSNLHGLQLGVTGGEKPERINLRIAHILHDVQESHDRFLELVADGNFRNTESMLPPTRATPTRVIC